MIDYKKHKSNFSPYLEKLYQSDKPMVIYKYKDGYKIFTDFSKRIVLNNSNIENFLSSGIEMKSGEKLDIDLMVTATGYKGQEHVVDELFGKSVVDKIGPIWGFDDERQELRNMWMQTKQPGLWFHAGSLAQCRIFSKFLALQIKATLDRII